MIPTKLITGATLASLIAVSALAHGGATGIVKQRMDGMGAMKSSMKLLAPMMRGKTTYDADTVRSAAATIEQHAGQTLAGLFPQGSGGKPSEAKSDIWNDWSGFTDLAAQLTTYSQGLALAAGNDLDAGTTNRPSSMMGGSSMMAGSGMMGNGPASSALTVQQLAVMSPDSVFVKLAQTCSACHSKFRSE
ncbi:MAG: cytochrome C [Rhodobacteraceae bacterium]|nr:MAG: cytochrome C [Paracoccaceae bacterium]